MGKTYTPNPNGNALLMCLCSHAICLHVHNIADIHAFNPHGQLLHMYDVLHDYTPCA